MLHLYLIRPDVMHYAPHNIILLKTCFFMRRKVEPHQLDSPILSNPINIHQTIDYRRSQNTAIVSTNFHVRATLRNYDKEQQHPNG